MQIMITTNANDIIREVIRNTYHTHSVVVVVVVLVVVHVDSSTCTDRRSNKH